MATLEFRRSAPASTGSSPRTWRHRRAVGVAIHPTGRIVVARTRTFWAKSDSRGNPQQRVSENIGLTSDTDNGADHTLFGVRGERLVTAGRPWPCRPTAKNLLSETSSHGAAARIPITRNGKAIAAYNATAPWDASFGTDGLRTSIRARLLQPSAVARPSRLQDRRSSATCKQNGGASRTINSPWRGSHVNGSSLDMTFSGDGPAHSPIQTRPERFGNAVSIQRSDGRIVAAGSRGRRIALARYHAFVLQPGLKRVPSSGSNGPTVVHRHPQGRRHPRLGRQRFIRRQRR
jgi:hypothetical protein